MTNRSPFWVPAGKRKKGGRKRFQRQACQSALPCGGCPFLRRHTSFVARDPSTLNPWAVGAPAWCPAQARPIARKICVLDRYPGLRVVSSPRPDRESSAVPPALMISTSCLRTLPVQLRAISAQPLDTSRWVRRFSPPEQTDFRPFVKSLFGILRRLVSTSPISTDASAIIRGPVIVTSLPAVSSARALP
jgi:hypothetical protein